MKLSNELFKGIWKENPVLVLSLGMCPSLATSSSAKNGLGMGLATTFVLATVFIPVAVMSGKTRIHNRQFALTIVIAISLSTFVALSLTPALCVMLIRAKSTADIVRPVMMGTDQNENGFFARFERGLDKVRRAY
ncbi:MAG: efflux RND transporter permease subunit, partial [Lentisphaeria bacterium]|nr:efflux RND transporter permease subunit [Lentisphaeria bacterium]